MTKHFVFLVSLAAVLLLSCSEKPKSSLEMPSDIESRVSDSVYARVWKGELTTQAEFNASRSRFAKMFLDSVRTRELDPDETIYYARLLHWAGKSRKAQKLLRPLAAGEDETARRAFEDLVTIESENDRLEEAERLMREFRRRFPPDPKRDMGRYLCVDDIVTRYNDKDRPAEAVQVILEEVESLPFDNAYRSFGLIGDLIPLMTELGRLGELRERAQTYRKRFEESLAKHLATPAPEDSTRKQYEKTTKSLEQYAAFMGEVLERIDMIGQKAPDLQFLHAYNADSSKTFREMCGDVTIVDFWATWCIACVVGYRELARIYADYKDRGLAVVGVTALQGKYRDGDPSRDEGSEREPLTKEREIELTRDYIERHHITWPCLVSTKPLKDTEYKVNGLPTYFIIDRNGVVRYLQVGIGKEKEMRRVIEKLLAEAV